MVKRADILVVEDDDADIAVAMRAFQRHDLDDRVEVLRDGREAVEALLSQQTTPKVVLLDLRMPRLDGKEVLRRLRADERTRTLPIVIVSASGHPDDIRECYELGANSYVTKQYGSTSPGSYLVEVATYWLDLNRVPSDPAWPQP